jgi:hypothetical protein
VALFGLQWLQGKSAPISFGVQTFIPYFMTHSPTGATTWVALPQAGYVPLHHVRYATKETLLLQGGHKVKLSTADLAALQEATLCTHTRHLHEAEKATARARQAYARAVADVDAHNAHLANLHQLRETAHALGQTDAHTRLLAAIRNAGAPKEYPRPPHLPTADLAGKPLLAVEGYVLSKHVLRAQPTADKVHLWYVPGEQPLSLKAVEWVMAFLSLPRPQHASTEAPAAADPQAELSARKEAFWQALETLSL